jgi:hypothetical protein
MATHSMASPPIPLSVLSRLSDEELLALAEKSLDVRRQSNPLAFYRPNQPIQKLIGLVSEKRPVVIGSTSNGLGKTSGVVNIVGNLFFGPQTRYFDTDTFRNWPFPKRIRYITTSKNVEEIGPFHSEITKWWPKLKYQAIKSGHTFYSQYSANGWILDVMTYDQDPKQMEGPTLGMIITDEPPPKPLWSTFASRLRMGGIILVVMTPLTEAAWFFDEVVPRHQEAVVYGTMEDACIEHGVNGHLEHKNIQNMIAEMDPEEREARAEGKAMYLRGLIWKTYDERVHVLKENIKPPYGAPVWQVVDPHSDKPFATTYAFPDARGDLFIFDEWPNEDFYKMHNCQLDIKHYKKIYADKEAGLNVHRRIIDRHFADTAAASNKRTLRQELQSIGLLYHPSYKCEEEVETGIIKVRERFAYDTSKPLSSTNQPSLYINPSCMNTRRSIARWARDPKNGNPTDGYKDFCDNLRYLVMDNPKIPASMPAYEPKKMWG